MYGKRYAYLHLLCFYVLKYLNVGKRRYLTMESYVFGATFQRGSAQVFSVIYFAKTLGILVWHLR